MRIARHESFGERRLAKVTASHQQITLSETPRESRFRPFCKGLFTSLFAIAVILWRLYEHTPLGRHLFLVGEGREAARLVGLKVDRLRVGAFVASGAISAIAGVFTA